MIDGVVNSNLEATVSLTLVKADGHEQEISAVVDTGFDGFLTLPREVISELNLPWRMCGRAMLADGSEILVDLFEATVLWDKKSRHIVVDAANTAPLVGMSLLKNCELRIQVANGGIVSISPLE